MNFEDLPIDLDETEYAHDGWSRTVKKHGTISDLLNIWDIDDPQEDCAMAQVLRHLRNALTCQGIPF